MDSRAASISKGSWELEILCAEWWKGIFRYVLMGWRACLSSLPCVKGNIHIFIGMKDSGPWMSLLGIDFHEELTLCLDYLLRIWTGILLPWSIICKCRPFLRWNYGISFIYLLTKYYILYRISNILGNFYYLLKTNFIYKY